MARTRALLFPLADRVEGIEESGPERLPLPHTFKPRLTFREALVAVIGAFLRIFLGSLLFAFWGTYSLAAFTSIHNRFWRVAVLLPMFLTFVVLFGLLLLGTSALVRTLTPKRS